MTTLARRYLPASLAALLVSMAALAPGCMGTVYNHPPPGTSASVSHYATWKITGDLINLPAAIDDNINTAAVSKSFYNNAYFVIDLGKPCVFNTVIIDHGLLQDGYSQRTAAYISQDGKNFQLQYTVPGTRRVTVLNWVTPVMARYVRVQAVAPGTQAWSVAEVYVQ